jgi:hypothetical protein
MQPPPAGLLMHTGFLKVFYTMLQGMRLRHQRRHVFLQ